MTTDAVPAAIVPPHPAWRSYLKKNGQAAIDAGRADLIGIGRPFLANPDLVERLRNDWPLNAWNSKTFYTEGPIGYIDCPLYVDESAQTSPAYRPSNIATRDARSLKTSPGG
jgi:hypothetical protein